jgi:predicted RNase H-like nuclease
VKLFGIDGCRAGWVVASADAELTQITFGIVTSISKALSRAATAESIVCIDIPIGLPDSTSRPCDVAARRRLRPTRTNSVFPAPMRAALAGVDYAEHCRLNVQACGKKLSKQASAILPKIREVDEAITPEMQAWVREVHPEVCFTAFAGHPMLHHKSTDEGAAERLEVLGNHGIALNPVVERMRLGRGAVELDDIIDAAACLLTASRIHHGCESVIGGELDQRGLRMEMVA